MIALERPSGIGARTGRIPAKYAGTGLAVLGIWVGVALTSLYSPDLIHGSTQDHLALAAIFTWMWGAIATAFVLIPLTLRHDERTDDGWWYALAVATCGIWLAVTLVSILTPREVTGSDPTQNPIGAMVAPVAGMVGTGLVALFVSILARGEKRVVEGRRRASRPSEGAVQSKVAGTTAAVLAIWTGVLLTSFFAPELVSGTEQEHTRVAALLTWFWGVIATAFVLLPFALRRNEATLDVWWYVLALVSSSIWLAVALVSVFTPRYVSGTDPSQLPIGAILAPIVGMVATGFLVWFVAAVARGDVVQVEGGAR